MKKIELLFYRTKPSEKNTGLKIVLWEIIDAVEIKTYDWGFAEWNGFVWEDIEVPEGYTAQVFSWANTVDPSHLINENKIISLR